MTTPAQETADRGAREAPTSRVAAVIQGMRERGFRMTASRQFVIQALDAATGHLSADQLHAAITAAGGTTDLSTVHRTLATLLDEGIVHATPTRRGLTYGLTHDAHQHALCDNCGRTFSIAAEHARYPAGLPTGFQPSALVIHGRCADCVDADSPPA